MGVQPSVDDARRKRVTLPTQNIRRRCEPHPVICVQVRRTYGTRRPPPNHRRHKSRLRVSSPHHPPEAAECFRLRALTAEGRDMVVLCAVYPSRRALLCARPLIEGQRQPPSSLPLAAIVVRPERATWAGCPPSSPRRRRFCPVMIDQRQTRIKGADGWEIYARTGTGWGI
jgi:hypothetical protein